MVSVYGEISSLIIRFVSQRIWVIILFICLLLSLGVYSLRVAAEIDAPIY